MASSSRAQARFSVPLLRRGTPAFKSGGRIFSPSLKSANMQNGNFTCAQRPTGRPPPQCNTSPSLGRSRCNSPIVCMIRFGGNGRTGTTASKNCAVAAYRSSMPRSPPVRRRGTGACQDTRRSKWPYATTFSTLSACPDSMSLPKHNPIEPPWYVTRMPGGVGVAQATLTLGRPTIALRRDNAVNAVADSRRSTRR